MEKQWEHTETIGKAILSSVVSRHPLTKGFLDTAELSMKRLRGNIGDPMWNTLQKFGENIGKHIPKVSELPLTLP